MNAAEKLVERAQLHKDPVRRFSAFYRIVHDGPVPPHAYVWLTKVFKAKEEDLGVVIKAFRGSTKSTTFNTFAAWITGERPAGCSLIIRGTDAAAKESSEQIADLISNNPGFKVVFPRVVPDTEKGWSQHGYEVKLDNVDYPEWR